MKKLFMLVMLVGCLAFVSKAQSTMKSTFDLASDTVTNTGTVWLQASNVKGYGAVTVQVNVTKISGTVGGAISLQGSLDGSNWSALNTEETQTALATKTAADASASYHWRLSKNPFTYYRVSWTGTGTMAASFTAKLLLNKD